MTAQKEEWVQVGLWRHLRKSYFELDPRFFTSVVYKSRNTIQQLKIQKRSKKKRSRKVHLEKTQGHWIVRSLAFPGETYAFALHLYRFSHGQSYFSFSKKIYGLRMGSRMRYRIGSRIESRFGVQNGGPRFVNTRSKLGGTPRFSSARVLLYAMFLSYKTLQTYTDF